MLFSEIASYGEIIGQTLMISVFVVLLVGVADYLFNRHLE